MGFLDRQSRVVDIVLTGRGRELFAAGELDFAYYAFFDDGIDYDPWADGQLSDEERDELIHSTPMLEAPAVPDRRGTVLPLEPTSFVFKAAPGYGTIPRLLQPSKDSPPVSLSCDQYSSGSLFIRSRPSHAAIDLSVSAEAVDPLGFSVHFYSSGSDGLTEVRPRVDLRGRRSLDPFVAVAIDDETVQEIDKPSPLRTNSVPRFRTGPEVKRR